MSKNRNRNIQLNTPLVTTKETTMAINDTEQTQTAQEDVIEQSQESTTTEDSTTVTDDTLQQPETEITAPVEEVAAPVQQAEVTSAPQIQNLGTQEVQAPPPVPVATVAPVVTPTVAKVAEVEQDITELDAAFIKIKASGTAVERALVNTLETYANGMKPGTPIDPDAGARHQSNLWQALRNVVQGSPDGEFKRLWNIVLAFAHQNRNGVFGDRYIFRFSEAWRFDTDELDAFQRLLNLINLTANIGEREKGLRSVDLTRSLDKGFNEHGRARLVSFYGN